MKYWLVVFGSWNLATLGVAFLMFYAASLYPAGPFFYGLLSAAGSIGCVIGLSGKRTTQIFWFAAAVSAVRPFVAFFIPLVFGASGHAEMMGWFLVALILGIVDGPLAIISTLWWLFVFERGRKAKALAVRGRDLDNR